jgi:outer membrane protein W
MIKNIFVNYNAPLGNDFMLSTRVGYGWDNNESVYGSGGDESVSEENINGFPVETEIKYKHFIERVSVFEPTIGVGIGYYNYTAKLKSGSSNETELITKGFGQYITFGMNIHISKSIVSSIQFKKIMINSISTERDTDDSYIEKDYVQGSGINDLSISLGIFYNINSGK